LVVHRAQIPFQTTKRTQKYATNTEEREPASDQASTQNTSFLCFALLRLLARAKSCLNDYANPGLISDQYYF
jgi:hypothetical protein